MGNVAIAFVESTISFSDYVAIKRQKRIEHKRIRQLIPRYLARLNNSDVSITTLNLNRLGVDIQILRLLSSPLLSGTTRVQSLYLEGNRIDVEGATCIARILSRDTNLVDVSLSHNPVESVGIISIASALEQNKSLQRLDLSYCDIDDDGITKLATSLKHSNTTLQNLNIEGNYISSSGIYALLKCIYDTSSMTSLWESNHTLCTFYSQQRLIYNKSFPDTIANKWLIHQIVEVLHANRRYAVVSSSSSLNPRLGYSPTTSLLKSTTKDTTDTDKTRKKVAAHKILRHYVKKDGSSNNTRTSNCEYWETVEGLEEKLIPNILGWLVRYGDMNVIYGVVRDIPWLLEPNGGGVSGSSGGKGKDDVNGRRRVDRERF